MTGEWRRLDRRTVTVTALTTAGLAVAVAVPTGLGFVRGGAPLGVVLAIAGGGLLLATALAAAGDLLRWRHTRYRVTDERVELRYAWVLHTLRSIPRERVRTVDLTANPLLRALGLTKVRIGTGQQATGTGNHLVLHPVRRAAAEELRTVLLDHAPTTAPPATAPTTEPTPGVPTPDAPPALAVLDWGWLRYAPISVSTPILGVAAFGGVIQAADWFQAQSAVFRAVDDVLGGLPIPLLVAVLAGVAVLVGVVGSLGLFVEMWWNYRLTREHGTLRVHRGLLTTRSLSLEVRRLRGVEVFEPLGARLAGAARVDAVATGLKTRSDSERTDPKTLLPAAPIAVARRVAADVLGATPLTEVELRAHPVSARSRRLRWALAAVGAVAAVLAVLGLLLTTVLVHLAWIAVLVLTPVAVAIAVDDYRNLGHGLTSEYLVTRYGAGSRHTVALERSGIIGWTVRSSPFQRRAGLITIGATTAANNGIYLIRDAGQTEGLRLAEAAVPGLLTPFLERVR